MTQRQHPSSIERIAYTVTEAAKALGVTKRAVYAAINEGILQTIRIGPTTVIPKSALDFMVRVALDRSSHPDDLVLSNAATQTGDTRLHQTLVEEYHSRPSPLIPIIHADTTPPAPVTEDTRQPMPGLVLEEPYYTKREPTANPDSDIRYTYPEWFAPLEALEGFKRRSHEKQIEKIRAICERQAVDPFTLCKSFSQYWPIGRWKHGWNDPVRALIGSIVVQIAKIKRGDANGEHSDNPTADSQDSTTPGRRPRGPATRRTRTG